jgi:hypothetical protein
MSETTERLKKYIEENKEELVASIKPMIIKPLDYVDRICQSYNSIEEMEKTIKEIQEISKKYNVKTNIDFG